MGSPPPPPPYVGRNRYVRLMGYLLFSLFSISSSVMIEEDLNSGHALTCSYNFIWWAH